MPNWCSGKLKVRGEVSNLKRFILEGLKPVGWDGETGESLREDKYGDIHYEGTCWICGTHRGFVEDIDIYLSGLEYGGTICLDSRFAWGISTEQLQAVCQKYRVDMKIYAFEKGMQFNQDIEIVDGRIVTDKEIKFSDYLWECIDPERGG